MMAGINTKCAVLIQLSVTTNGLNVNGKDNLDKMAI